MIETTLGTAIAAVVASLGLASFVNGVRYGLPRMLIYAGGCIGLLFVAYWITTLGHVL